MNGADATEWRAEMAKEQTSRREPLPTVPSWVRDYGINELPGPDRVQQRQSDCTETLNPAAGIAHELGNAASFVHGGLASLRAYANVLAKVIRAHEQGP